ncbi:MAG TPA: carboxy terminal-processing peptidase [Kofleriaceae bacterium]|nr:carboxy terminal-processing peptidase [Kofleriaceae bacterium]
MRSAAAVLLVLLTSAAACTGAGSPSGEPAQRSAQASPTARPVPPPDPREVKLSAIVVKLLEEEHLRHRKLDDALSRKAFDQYLEQLDPSKMFLLKADAQKLEAHADRIDDELRAGRLDLAHDGAALFANRVAVVEKVVADILARPLDFSDEEFIETDPEKMELAASEEELRERWRRRLELEVLEQVAMMEQRAEALAKGKDKDKGKDKKKKPVPGAPGEDMSEDDDAGPALSAEQIPPTAEGREQKARTDLAKRYAGRFARLATPKSLDAAAAMVNAVTTVFDPHTNYLPPAEEDNFNIHMSGALEGIGAVLREDDHYIRVVEIVPGGASWRQGQLEAEDLIKAVAQEGKDPVDTGDMPIDDVVAMIRGPKGTKVTLTVEKPTGETKVIAITRDVVVIEEAYARGAVIQVKGSPKSYGYIYLPSFYGGQMSGTKRTAAGDVRRLLAEMKKRKVAGVVVDIRGNGGGLLDDAVEMTGLLIDRGPVVQTQQSDGNRDVLSDDHAGTTFDGAAVVMVDRFSASASEILAGALQDYRRAVIVGTGPTHGKGTVQVLANLDKMGGETERLGSLKITIQQFFRVSGASTQWQGVVPDILLPDPAGHIEAGERQLDNSIPWSQIDPVPHRTWPGARWKPADLAARSAKRTSSSEVFRKIAARAELQRQWVKDTRVPLKKQAFTAQRAERRAALEAVTPKLDEGPARLTVTVINYDGKATPAARPNGGKADDTVARWRDALSRNPWVEEALLVLQDAEK